MATITTTQSGLASAGSTWVGGVPPVTGDVVVRAHGHVLHWDTGLTTAGAGVLLGSNSGGVGHAVTNGDGVVGDTGSIIVDNGATLYLRGFDLTSNTLCLNNRYGTFTASSGSTIIGDIAGDFTSFFLNKGLLNLNGCTLSVPAANVSWAKQITSESSSGETAVYDNTTLSGGLATVWTLTLVNDMISNAAGTGIGSLGDTSLSFASVSPAGILASEVASIALVNGVGKYWVDYNAGIIVLWTVGSGPSCSSTYKCLDGTSWKGWGIDSTQGTSFNSCVITGCTLTYMGGTSTSGNGKPVVKAASHLTAGANSAATDRLFQFTGNTLKWGYRGVDITSCTGTAGDYLLCESNTLGAMRGLDSGGTTISSRNGKNTYLSVSNNTISGNRRWLYTVLDTNAAFQDHTGLKIDGNTGQCIQLYLNFGLPTRLPGGSIQNNNIQGYGSALNFNLLATEPNGAPGNPVTVAGNTIDHGKWGMTWGSYCNIYKNWFKDCYAGPIVFHGGYNDTYVTQTAIYDNLITYGSGDHSSQVRGAITIGQGTDRIWVDNVSIFNNTSINASQGIVVFGDLSSTQSIGTNLTVANNLAYNTTSGGSTGGVQGIKRPANAADIVTRFHTLQCDYGLYYNVTNQYTTFNSTKGWTFTKGGTNYNTQTGARNLPGLALQFPSYTTTQTQLAIRHTVNAAGTDETLQFSSDNGSNYGTAVQLVLFANTLSASPTTISNQSYVTARVLTDSTQTWSTTLSDATCPRGHILKMTSGAASGQLGTITNNTATTVTVAPAFTVAPSSSDSYTIYKLETVLNNSGATASVGVGLDPNVFAFGGSTATDTGISLGFHDAGNVNPILASPGDLSTAIHAKITSSSPAKDVGTSVGAPATDYFGTGRPQNSLDDIGFHELVTGTVIDNTWLTNNGGTNGPWPITVAGLYSLATNPTALGTGFLINVSGVSFDLQGHTITFNNRASPVVLDQFFTTVGGALSSHWDFTGATSAVAVPITDTISVQGGFRDWSVYCLKLNNYTTTQVIKSANIAIPAAKIEYVATVFSKTTVNQAATIVIEVVDAVTGVTIGATPDAGTGSGYINPLFFVPVTTNAVFLRFTLSTNASSTPTVTYLGYAAIDQGRDVGILCSGRTAGYGGAGAITGATNATPIKITSSANGMVTGDRVSIDGVLGNTAANGYWQVTRIDGDNFTLNGSVGNGVYAGSGIFCQNGDYGQVEVGSGQLQIQLVTGIGGSPKYNRVGGGNFTLTDSVGGGLIVAANAGWGSTPVIAQAITATVTNIAIQAAGMDSRGIDAIQTLGLTVTGCTITGGGTRLAMRQHLKGHIDCANQIGSVLIQNNTIISTCVAGIFCNVGSDALSTITILVDNNTIYPNTRYTDQYGITFLNMPYGGTISNNTINSVGAGRNGRGILVDNEKPTARDVLIFGNTINVYETWNLEYDRIGYETTGIRIRGHADQNITGYYVHDNTITAQTDTAGNHFCYCIRPSVFNSLDALMRIENNTCTVVVTDASLIDASVAARGGISVGRNTFGACISIDGMPLAGTITFRGNTFESNDTSVLLGENDDYNDTISGAFFIGNTFTRHTGGGTQTIAYLPVGIGDWLNTIANTKFVGSTYVNTSAPDLSVNSYWGDWTGDKQVRVGWQIAVTVTDSVTGLALPGATCVVKNTLTTQDDSQTTGALGTATVTALTDLWHRTGDHSSTKTHTTYSPHTLEVSQTGYLPQTINLGTLSANATQAVVLVPVGAPTATGYTLTAPSPASGAPGVASANFVLAPSPIGSAMTSPVVITPSDGGFGGTFTPATVTLSSAIPGSFTYTPPYPGVRTISTTNNGGLSNPLSVTYTATRSRRVASNRVPVSSRG